MGKEKKKREKAGFLIVSAVFTSKGTHTQKAPVRSGTEGRKTHFKPACWVGQP